MKNKNKVLHIITNYDKRGGAESMLSRVLRGMPSNNESHYVVSLIKVNPDFIANSNIDGYYELKLNSFLGIFRVFKVFFIILKYSPNVIVGWMYHGCIFSTLMSFFCFKKNVWNIRHSLDDLSIESKSTRLAILVCKFFSYFPSRVIFNSRKAIYQHINYGFYKPNIVYIPNGFYVNDFKVKSLPCSKNIKVLIVGRNHPSKGFLGFLNLLKSNDFFSKFKNVSLTIVGRNSSKLVEDAYELVRSGKLVLIEELADLSNVYCEYDILILPSLNEGFPNVLCEAALSGLVCLSTNVGDAETILNDNKLLFDRSDYFSFYSAYSYACSLVNDPEYLKSFRNSFVERYSIEKIINEYRFVFFK